MATGPETLNLILESAVDWANAHEEDPTLILLPVRMAWNLAKCRRKDIGPISDKVMKKGIAAFEKHGLFSLKVKIVREKDADLKLE